MNNRLLKHAITATAALVVITSGASPAPRFEAANAYAAPDSPDEAATVLIDEDFSLWVEGSPEEPIYLGEIENFYVGDMNYDINPERMQNGKTWGGYATCTAGGMCALAYPGVGGSVQTNMGDFSGTLHITAKVKMLDGQNVEQGAMVGAVCKGWLNPQPACDNPYCQILVDNDGEWHEVDWTCTNTYGGDDCYIQFNTYNMMLIDDIKITAEYTSLGKPILLPATDYTYDGFTANWEGVAKATDYLLTCWRDVRKSDEPGKMVCNFDDINNTDGVINMDDPNFPDGWEFDFNGAEPRILTPADGLESNAFCFSADGQTITTPSTGAPIKDVFMKLRILGDELETEYPGNMTFAGWDGSKWCTIGSLYFDNDFYGEYYQFNEIGQIMQGNYYKLQISVRYMDGNYRIALDDLDITTLPPTEPEYALTDFPVEGTSYKLTGLDPCGDYYYQVVARNTELGIDSGEPDAVVYAFGVPRVTPKPASEIDSSGAYTANWETTPKAQEYIVSNYLVYKAPEDTDNYTVFEENFPNADYGFTVQDPYAFNNFEFMNLDAFCENMGWIGYLCGLAEYAIGGIGAYGYGGEIQSPWLSLANDGGKYTVTVSACGAPGDNLSVRNAAGECFYFPLTEDYEDYTMEFEKGTDFDCLAFSTSYAGNFFINYVEIKQNLKKGDRVLSQRNEITTTDNFYRFANLEMPGEDYSYAYTVKGVHRVLTDVAYSPFSEVEYVDFTQTRVASSELSTAVNATALPGAISVAAASDTEVAVFSTNGMRIVAFTGSDTVQVPAGMYIVKAGEKTFKLVVK